MNAKSGKMPIQKKQQKKDVQGLGGQHPKKSPGKIQAKSMANGKNGTFQADMLSKYCWQSNDLDRLSPSPDKPKRKDGLP